MDFARRIHYGVATSAVESAASQAVASREGRVLSGLFRARLLLNLRLAQRTLRHELLNVFARV